MRATHELGELGLAPAFVAEWAPNGDRSAPLARPASYALARPAYGKARVGNVCSFYFASLRLLRRTRLV
jgi:hypothetical protein